MKGWTILLFTQFVAAVLSAAVPRSTVPELSNMKLVKEVVGTISGSRTTSPPVLSARPGLRFHPQVASTCFMAAIQKFYSHLGTNKRETQKAICRIADQYDTCIAPYKTRSAPREKLAFDFAIKGARYLCTKEGYKSYQELAPCLTNVKVMNELDSCAQQLSSSAHDFNFCRLFEDYTSCAVEATHNICTKGTKGTVKEALTVLLSPMTQAICLAKTSGPISTRAHELVPKRKLLSRFRRQGFEEMAGLMGGGSMEELAGQMTPSEFTWGEMAGTPQMTPSEFAWGDLAGMSPDFTMPEFSWGGETATAEEQSMPGFSWEDFPTLPPYLTGQEISSEEVSTMSPDVAVPEMSSEEVSTMLPDVTTPDTSSEEVSTLSQDVTTPEPGSEEVSTTSPDVTTPEDSSEEVSTTSDVTTPEPGSEEVSTTSPDVTTPEDSSEEVSTTSDVTTPEPGSEEVSTTSPDVTTPGDSSEEVSTTSPDVTTPEDSSEEESSMSPNGTTPEPGSEEVSASPDVTTPGASSEEASTSIAPDTTKLGPATVTTLEIPTTTATNEATTSVVAPVVTEPAPVAATIADILSTPAIITVPEVTAPVTTTTGHQVPPFQCYECHSGAHGYWQNSNCPPNGEINGWAAQPNVCYGQCVSVVTRFPKGEVYRSCSTSYYFPFQTPYDGCVKHNQELFCFCSGDLCNNRDMSHELKAYILEALIVQK